MNTDQAELTRQQRIARVIVVTIILTTMIIATFAYYTHKISTELFQLGADNVEETYREVGQLVNEITESTQRDLEFMNEHMRETATTYDERAAVIQQFREKIGFTYFFLLDDDGNYTGARGGSGNFGFGENRSALLRENEHSVLDATLSDGERIILYVYRVENTIIYNDHVYTAIAIAYNEKDMGETLKVTAYNGSSYPYILNANGRAIITSDRTTAEGKVDNLITYLEGDATIESASAEDVVAAFRNQETMTVLVHDHLGDFYLTFQPLGVQDYMLAAFTPVEAVDESIEVVRTDTIKMIALAVGLIFVLVMYGLGVLAYRSMRHKDAALRDKDEVIESKDEQIDVKNRELEERNAQLEVALDVAQSASQAKTNFLSNMSHDIRTPMNAIIGFTTLAGQEIDNKDKVREYLGKIQDSSHHLLNLINDVLDYSKIEAGKVSLHQDEVNIETVVERIDSMMRTQASDKEQTFTVHTQFLPRCIVEADELRITQILVNILSNAIKYTPQGGQITLDMEHYIENHIAYYKFVISDNGIGISEEYLQTLYDPFTREVKTTTNKVQGTGLGMAITKNLIDLMSGTIDVDSRKDVGTTVRVRFGFKLLRLLDDEEEHAESTAVEDISIAGMRVLIAEDNALNAEIIEELLRMEGCEVDMTENGRLCAERFWSQPQGTYDLILMDIQMPEMNGYDATRAIRLSDHPDARQIPIIAMTANAFNDDKRDAIEAGMNAHVAKPVDMKVLKKAIRKVMDYSTWSV